MNLQLFKYSAIIFLFATCIENIYGQATQVNGGVQLSKAIPPGPDAAALGKYGSVPISYYTGVPNISIPLYEIKSKVLNVPITLNYFAGGIKVEEIASSVGLGWSLNCGGVITRTVRGLPDDASFGFIDGNKFVSQVYSLSPTDPLRKQYLTDFAEGTFDGEADLYYFNFCGYAGKFTTDENGNCFIIPDQKIKIQYNIYGAAGICTWTLTTPDGIQYNFGSYGQNPDLREIIKTYNSCDQSGVYSQITTAWYLKSIVSPINYNNTINFNYTRSIYSYQTKQAELQYKFDNVSGLSDLSQADLSAPPLSNCFNNNEYLTVSLSSIDFDNGHLFFYYDQQRSDIAGLPKVSRIKIQGDGTFKKQYLFINRYFNNNTYKSRMRLDELQEVIDDPVYAGDGIHFLPVNSYKFDYNNDVDLPDRLSNAQDAWGFYNGHNENTTLVPKMLFRPQGSSITVILPGAERSPDETYMQAGMLKKITYPTGGYTTFIFEGNRQANLTTSYIRKISQIATPTDENGGRFEVVSNSSMIQVNYHASGIMVEGDPENSNFIRGEIWTVDAGGNLVSPIASIYNGDGSFLLTPGKYKFIVNNSKHETATYSMQIWWVNDDATQFKNQYAGGLRIKQIIDYDPVADKQAIRNFKYFLNGDENYSSGSLVGLPLFSYNWGLEKSTQSSNGNGGGGTIGVPYYVYFLVRKSTSNYPLATTQGAFVGYSQVTVEYGNGASNGKSEYFFTSPQSYPDITHTDFPFAPDDSYDWTRGLLLNQVDYKKQANTFSKVKEEINDYGVANLTGILGIKVGYNPSPCNGCAYEDINAYVKSTFFYTPTEWQYLHSTKERIYNQDGSGSFNETSTTYDYDNSSYLPAIITSINSKNETKITHQTYPGTYHFMVSNPAGLDLLVDKHILTPIIEKYVQKQNANGSNLKTVGGAITTYRQDWPLPDIVYQLQTAAPLTSFLPTWPSNYVTLVPDVKYRPVILNKSYDIWGNILQHAKVNNTDVSYIWDYKNNYPIAEVVNAVQSDIAYTSFEGDGTGGWTFSKVQQPDATAPTGKMAFYITSSNGGITKSGLSTSKKYIVTYWAKHGVYNINGAAQVGLVKTGRSANGWTYYEHKIIPTSTTINISGNSSGVGSIDELRLYSDGAQMSTYTYEPLIGITSQCDINNRITYYEYDAANRLNIIRDQDKKILKKYSYVFYNNSDATPQACNINTNCTGVDKKCINGFCEAGKRVNTSTIYKSSLQQWKCTYHYEWTDESVSQNPSNFTEYHSTPCDLDQ